MSPDEPPRVGRSVPTLDVTDRRLIEFLREDGRCSVNELAERAGISRANAYQRMGRLRSTGVITGFTVRTDPRRTGLSIGALVIVSGEQHSWRDVLERLRHLPGPVTWRSPPAALTSWCWSGWRTWRHCVTWSSNICSRCRVCVRRRQCSFLKNSTGWTTDAPT